jgi:hypothetical protein
LIRGRVWTGQLSFATLDYAGKKKRTKSDLFLSSLSAFCLLTIRRERFCASEQQSALNFAASRARECVALKSWQRGIRRNRPHENHLSVAHQAPHRSTTPCQSGALREMIKLVLEVRLRQLTRRE